MIRRLLSATTLTLAIFAAHGPTHARQAPAPQPAPAKPLGSTPAPAFDVAAIHLHESLPHEHNSIWSSPFDGNFHAENISVITLIDWAYETPDTRILGAPGWASSTMFNIEARANSTVDQQMHSLTGEEGRRWKEKMVQTLLADRFQMAMHYETRELPIYDLVVAKNGPKLGAAQNSGSSVNVWYGRMEVQMPNSVAVLADELSKVAGRDVIDKTGIAGRYDLKLRFTPDQGPAMLNGQPVPDAPPDLFTALQEQLGLKLVSEKGPVRVLVIDRISMPTAN